jgi:hypothetical protein
MWDEFKDGKRPSYKVQERYESKVEMQAMFLKSLHLFCQDVNEWTLMGLIPPKSVCTLLQTDHNFNSI